MKFKQLKTLIQLIKKSIKCPQCGKIFDNNEIELTDIYEDEGLIDAKCTPCQAGISVSIEIQEFSNGMPPKIVEQVIQQPEITDSEVQTFSQAIRLHKGGINELLHP